MYTKAEDVEQAYYDAAWGHNTTIVSLMTAFQSTNQAKY